MILWILEMIAVALFLRYVEWSDMRRMLPIMITASFLRFIEHFLMIDWLKLWKITANGWMEFVNPTSADMTIWPIGCYFFIKHWPKKGAILYVVIWTIACMIYLKILLLSNIFTMPKWSLWKSGCTIAIYWLILHWIAKVLVTDHRQSSTPQS